MPKEIKYTCAVCQGPAEFAVRVCRRRLASSKIRGKALPGEVQTEYSCLDCLRFFKLTWKKPSKAAVTAEALRIIDETFWEEP